MKIHFSKLEGLGNDFILLDGLKKELILTKARALKLCDRHFGIGADGILLLLKPKSRGADFRMRIFNADGSEAEMCGNGIRCLARYLFDRGLSKKIRLRIETRAGIMEVERRNHLFRVCIGRPEFAPEKVPVLSREPVIGKVLSLEGQKFRVTCVSVGNPHCVIPVENLPEIDLHRLGPKLENHPWFPNRINVELVEVVSRDHLQVRVWERGVGETLACGTGACAAVVACARLGLCNHSARVSLPGGDLGIEWKNDACYLTGPARLVYQGQLDFGRF